VTGHFAAVHEWETNKPAETMWVQAEVWDDEARKHAGNLRKGQRVSGVGCLIFNKWTDKATGEERKQFKMRISKFMPSETLQGIVDEYGLAEEMNIPSAGEEVTTDEMFQAESERRNRQENLSNNNYDSNTEKPRREAAPGQYGSIPF
jgi:single-stranded DNA-binding protein